MAKLDLESPFPSLTFDEWRARVERDLKGADFQRRLVTPTVEGIDVQPLYHGLTESPPLDRARAGWSIAQRVDCPAPEDAARVVAADLALGAEQIRVAVDLSARLGGAPAGNGVVLDTVEALATVLAPIDLTTIPVAFNSGGRAMAIAALLAQHAERQGLALSALSGELGADPLGALAADGALPCSASSALAELAPLARWCLERAPGLRAVRVSVAPHQESGAHMAQSLSWALGTGVTYLRALTEGGLSVAEAAHQMTFEVVVGRDLFMAMAGLRALRRLWGRVLEASGAAEAAEGMLLHGRTARHTLSRRDVRVNMLRTTGAAFAAVLGGADSVSVTPFDRPLGSPTLEARRHAIHIQHLLRDEAHLGRVLDPAGGSAYIEQLTDALCEKAWAGLQQIERERGMVRRVRAGLVAAAVAETAAARRRRLATRKDPLVGVSAFPSLDEPRRAHAPLSMPMSDPGAEDSPGAPSPASVEAWSALLAETPLTAVAPGADAITAPALAPFREAHDFEYLRDWSDGVLANTGARPAAFLANLGPLAHHKARADFSAQLLAAGGVASLDRGGFDDAAAAAAAFTESGARVAVICGRDPDYVERAAAFAEALKAAGARKVLLAGRPGEREAAWREAGVDTFIHLGVDAIAVLTALMEEIGQ